MLSRTRRQRQADGVIAYLRVEKQPLLPYQILKRLCAKELVTPTTVCRAITRFAAADRVHRIEPRSAWTASSGPCYAETPVFEICDECGTVTELHDVSFAQEIDAFCDRTDVAADRSVIELRSRCGDCRAGAPTA